MMTHVTRAASVFILCSSAAADAFLCAAVTTRPSPKRTLPPLPDSTGWGVHVLAVARDPQGTIWVGTYGQGIYRLPVGRQRLGVDPPRHDAASRSPGTSSQAIAFGSRGEIWYGTVGNGWGLSTDGGATWKNWTYKQLGPEWQYVAPSGIVVRGDTTVIGTADGLQLTTDDGATLDGAWPTRSDLGRAGPADTVYPVLRSEYVRRVAADRRGWNVATLRGSQRLRRGPSGWEVEPLRAAAFPPANALLIGRQLITGHALRSAPHTPTPCPVSGRPAPAAERTARRRSRPGFAGPSRSPITASSTRRTATARPWAATSSSTRVSSSTIPTGRRSIAIGSGTVVYAGPAEAGALTVTIRHDTTVTANGKRYRLFSTYYHNSALNANWASKVRQGRGDRPGG